MRTFSKLELGGLIAMVLFAHTLSAAPEPQYIEHASLILNLSTGNGASSVQGSVLAKPCEDCPPQRIEINDSTKFFLHGKPADPEQLGLKIDWQGSVFYLPDTVPVATELFLN